jgi:hypothetical protein
MPRPTRVPTKIQWGLDDILDANAQARAAYEAMRQMFWRTNDAELVKTLLKLHEALAEIELRAKDARGGIYTQAGERTNGKV